MKYNTKLNLKSIIRTEQFLKKPFGEIDYSSESDLKAMLYCVVLCNNSIQFTFEEFDKLSVKMLSEMIKELEEDGKILAQFQRENKSSESDSESTYIGDLVATLIVDGLDASFALNEMSLVDLPIYIEAYERKKKEQIESSRLWCYLSILPHVDGKKLKSPSDLYPLPWELGDSNERSKDILSKNGDMLDKFLNGEIKLK